MRTGLTISTLLHIALLVWLFVTLPSTKIESTESVPVDVISDSDLHQIMAGVKTAQRVEAPKPIVDKPAPETTPVKDPTPKVSDKPEIIPNAGAPPPAPEPPEAKPEKAEAKPAKVEPQVDEIAEALKREEAKKKEEAKKLAEAKKREEAKKKREEEAKKREQQKFDITSIENALIDRRAPQRQAATGASLNQTASLGAPTAAGPTLSQNEIDALKARLRACWDVPVGMQNARDLIVTVRIHFKRDGSLAADPVVENQSMLPIFRVAAESALRAVRKCAPYTFMPPAKYEAWQDVEVDFDPREMFGG